MGVQFRGQGYWICGYIGFRGGTKKGRGINPTLTWGPLGKLSVTEFIRHLIQCLAHMTLGKWQLCLHVASEAVPDDGE